MIPRKPKDEIHVRRATPQDLDAIVRFNQAMAQETEGKRLDPHVVQAGVRKALCGEAGCSYFVAELEQAPAGQIMFTQEWSDWRNGFFWWIQSVYVAPAHRRRGVFRALYDHVRTLARAERDVVGIRLYVHEHNTRAMQTYEQLGMTTTAYRLCEEDWSDDGR